jgi:hypothetical protein
LTFDTDSFLSFPQEILHFQDRLVKPSLCFAFNLNASSCLFQMLFIVKELGHEVGQWNLQLHGRLNWHQLAP